MHGLTTQRVGTEGSTLLTVMGTVAVLALGLASALTMSEHQFQLGFRDANWERSLHLAEAGIEEAMAHLAQNGTNVSSMQTQGWTLDGTNYVKTNTLVDGTYRMQISTDTLPTVASTGVLPGLFGIGTVQRTVEVTTTVGASTAGIRMAIAGKGQMEFDANYNPSMIVDSFDSSSGLYSDNGVYDVAKRKDAGNVGTTSSGNNQITLNAGSHFFGKVETGGTATVGVPSPNSVGSLAWNGSGMSGIQPGWKVDNYNEIFPEVKPPTGAAPLTSFPATLGPGLFTRGSSTLSSVVTISGDTTLYINGALNVGAGGRFVIPDGARLTVIVTSESTWTGNPVDNQTGRAANFSLMGTSALTAFHFKPVAGTSFIGTIYMPTAQLEIGSGGANNTLTGAVVGGSLVHFNGGWKIHYDEALNGVGPKTTTGATLSVLTWAER